MRMVRQCPYEAGHDMAAKFVLSWMSRSEHAQVLVETIAAWRAMPPEYADAMDRTIQIAELEARLDSLDGAPF